MQKSASAPDHPTPAPLHICTPDDGVLSFPAMSTDTPPRHDELLSMQEVRRVAKLAHLQPTDEQLEQYRTQLAAVLGYISMLNELDVTGVEPMAHPVDITNRLEVDEVADPMPVEHLMRIAPATEGRYLAVPKVLDTDGNG